MAQAVASEAKKPVGAVPTAGRTATEKPAAPKEPKTPRKAKATSAEPALRSPAGEERKTRAPRATAGLPAADARPAEGGLRNEVVGIGVLAASLCLMLALAYAASIGGLGTIIGTPPNTIMVAQIDKLYGQTISFLDWMKVGVPLAATFLG